MITVDSRRCGGGKTTDPQNGIYARIRNHIKRSDRVLVVVPSIHLQHQYQRDLVELHPYIINSQNNQSTTLSIMSVFRNPQHDLVVITHSAFLKLPQSGYRSGWHLIIDEALDEVINIMSVAATDSGVWNPQFDLSSLFDWSNQFYRDCYNHKRDDDTNWGCLELLRTPQTSMLDNSETWRRLTNANYATWMTARSWTTLNDQCGGSVKIIQTLQPQVLDGWCSVHIAAAAFHHTAMSYWMNANNISYRVLHPFVPQAISATIHTIQRMRWSKNKLNTQPQILDQFQRYVSQHASGPVMALRNSGVVGNHYDQVSVQPKHNSYGINLPDWQQCCDVSLETALVPDPLLIGFIKDHWLVGMDKYQVSKAITHMWSAYRFHQIIYRTTIRTGNPQHLNIFVLDEGVGTCLIDYWNFSNKNVVADIDIQTAVTKSAGRPRLLTDEQRRAKRREYDLKRNSAHK